MATQAAAVPIIHPQNVRNGWAITSLSQVPPLKRDPNKAAFIPARTAVYNAPVDDREDSSTC
jgi:hypothetical protein